MNKEDKIRKEKITSILAAVSFRTEQEREKQVQDLFNKKWPVEQIFKNYEPLIQPQKLEQVLKEIR